MKILNVVGARPNFMKMAPIIEAMKKSGENGGMEIEPVLVHTGQHYDERMSKLFFRELRLPRPNIDLEVGSGTHAQQTAEIIKRFEPVLIKEKPRCVLVVGDVNSTIACAITAVKLGVDVVHVEAGLRSFDRTMPEEINRVLTDAISHTLFITESSAIENLEREGIGREKVFFVGNVMIDTLLKNVQKALASTILISTGLAEKTATEDGVVRPYGVLTLHRPSNVDNKESLSDLISTLSEAAKAFPLIFPVHPRTLKRIEDFGLGGFIKKMPVRGPGIYVTEPLGYLDFLRLMKEASLVLTDSGGIQEETTILGVPCITLRDNTERPVTIVKGTNRLVGTDRRKILEAADDAINGRFPGGRVPELWDGKAGERIVDVLVSRYG